MNFCRLPPDRLCAAASGPAGLDVEAPDQRCGERAATSPMRIQPPRPTALGARQQRVLRQRQRRHRAAAEPLLGHEVQAQLRAAARGRGARDVACRTAGSQPAGARVSSPDSAAISSCWPLPETPAMPTISPARTSKRDVVAGRRRTGPRCGSVRPSHREHHRAGLALRGAAAAAARRRSSGATALALVSCVGSTSPVTLPPRSTVQAVAQRADLVELVADVEDAAAFGGELAQRDEQLLAPPAASAPRSARRGSAAWAWSAARARSRPAGVSPTDSVCTGRSGSTSRPYSARPWP